MSKAVFWFRRDLRIEDNVGLFHALKENDEVIPIFIFDKNILDDLKEKTDKRLIFIYDQLKNMNEYLKDKGSTLETYNDTPEKAFKKIIEEFEPDAVYTNEDYEPYAIKRDKEIKELLEENDIKFKSFKDQVIFAKDEIEKNDGGIYTVYTPYKKKWRKTLTDSDLDTYNTDEYSDNFTKLSEKDIIPLEDMGFEYKELDFPTKNIDEELIKKYDETRDIPGIRGTSRLSVHLRFGTISVRKLANYVKDLNDTFLDELIWREFYMTVLWKYPESAEHNFRRKYDSVKWRNNKKEFEAWCEGKTGFPMVDAGMRELNETGFMHNRVRMITSNFLTKLMLIDWKWGESYFAEKLLDYEMSSNVGNWQWAAGTGCDAAPYFRIFNPSTQIDKFDEDKEYIKKWIPEYGTDDYPDPIIDYKESRHRALDTYKEALD